MSEAKSSPGSIRELLSQTTVADTGLFEPKREAVVVKTTHTVVEACQLLAKHGISSAPVYDELDHSFKGMIDFRDICTLLARAYSSKGHSGFQDLLTVDVQLTDLIQHGLVGNTPVSLVTDLSSSNPLKGVHLKNTLLEVVSHFLDNVHRVCVFHDDGAFVGVLSQSDIVKFLYERHESIKDATFDKTLKELGLGTNKALTISWDKYVIEAITLMAENRVSSVALTEGDKVWGVLSMSDVKYLTKRNKFVHLKETCGDFISSVRQYQALENHHGKDSIPVFTVHDTSKLISVLGKLFATRAHRVFVVVPHEPLGVVSLTDILKVLTA